MLNKTEARARNEALNQSEWERQVSSLKSYPTTAYLEITNRCNSNCIMCGRNFGYFQYGDMSISTLRNCFEFLPFLNRIILTGWGEPLVHPRFFEILNFLSDAGLENVLLQSNGRLLDGPSAEYIVRTGIVKHITLSIDGVNTSTFASIRKGITLDHVIKAVLCLNHFKNAHRTEYPHIGFEFVAMKRNIREFPALAGLAAELGIEGISAVYLTVHDQSLREESLFFHQSLANEIFDLTAGICRDLKLHYESPPRFGPPREGEGVPGPRRCLEPWQTIYIHWDGTVSPCCFSSETMGNIAYQPFSSIWDGPSYRGLRSTINTDRRPPYCKTCHSQRFQDPDDEHTHLKIPPGNFIPRLSYYYQPGIFRLDHDLPDSSRSRRVLLVRTDVDDSLLQHAETTLKRLFPGSGLDLFANASILDRLGPRFPASTIHSYISRGAFRPFLSKLAWAFKLARKYDAVGISCRENEQNSLMPPSILFPFFSGLTLFALFLRPKYILAIWMDRIVVYSSRQVLDIVTGLDRLKISRHSFHSKIRRLSRLNWRSLIAQMVSTAVKNTWRTLTIYFLGIFASFYAVALTFITILAASASDLVRIAAAGRKSR